MNYIRGAVNAISAPYQYYKDLPPLNPSTLTGAIDVIVIQRPTDNGDTELVCSPFHVRFGKWQVLRPGEKKVNVFVNGNPIPFNMKIGEAGEAFFVFETDDDVPADLITSPILQPTIPSEAAEEKQKEEPTETDRFGAKQDRDKEKPGREEPTSNTEDQDTRVEPDFLDLDGGSPEEDIGDDVRTTPKQTFTVPLSLRKSGSRATINQRSALGLPSPPPSRGDSPEPQHVPEIGPQDERVDAAVEALREQEHVPEVEYHHDITLDMEGYKTGYHDREASDQTVRSSSSASTSSRHPDSNGQFKFPRKPPTSSPTKPTPPLSHTQSAIHSAYAPSPENSPSPSSSRSSSPNTSLVHPFPFRATSEPPPDIDSENDIVPALSLSSQVHTQPKHPRIQLQMPMQEYSWEWGAFPQPSPMKASFGKGGRIEPPHKGIWGSGEAKRNSRTGFGERKERLISMALPPAVESSSTNAKERTAEEEGYERAAGGSGVPGRSRSVPPHFLGSPGPGRKGRRGSREYKEYEDADDDDQEEEERGRGGRPWAEEHATEEQGVLEESMGEMDGGTFGAGGTVSSSRDDPSMFVLSIEGRKIGFQLSLVPAEDDEGLDTRGEKKTENQKRDGTHSTVQDEFGVAQSFERYRIEWNRFLEDDSIVDDPRLVIRWGTNQYITRKDGSPLMDALVHWRSSALTKRASGDALRPVSPPPPPSESTLTDEQHDEQLLWETGEQRMHARSESEPPSSADVRQAEDDKKAEAEIHGHGQGAAKKPTSSSWVQWWSRSRRKDAAAASASGANGNDSKGYFVLDPKNDSSTSSLPLPPRDKAFLDEKQKSISSDDVKTSGVPTTPVQLPADRVQGSSPISVEQETTPTRPSAPPPVKRFAKTLRLTSDQLKSLNLRPGANAITFSLSASGAIAATARIFVWSSTDLVVISDIDGTITKSDGLGHVFAMIGRDWTHVGVAKLYTDIVRNGYKIMYLTSRAIGQADATRDYLKGIKQNNYQLPEGPVIMSPDRLMASLHREVIMRKPELFKMACLRDIQRLFGESVRNPFYAGFGNRITDALSYRSVNVPSARIFTIDTSGEVKMELLELAGYKSSYIHMTDLVDQMFPPIHRKWAPEFTDFNYWKTPVQEFSLPDFSPPSPALSARSDTSNQSALTRLRNFSLGGNANTNIRQHISKQSSIASAIDGLGFDGDTYRNSHLRQMSSFEKLSSTLGFMSMNNGDPHGRSASPSSSSSYVDSDDEDGEDGELGPDGQRRKRVRRRSMTSMPGTLDETHFGLDDDDEDEGHAQYDDDDGRFVHGEEGEEEEGAYDGEGEESGDPEEEAEEAFDDDILAAGEMQNVPFL